MKLGQYGSSSAITITAALENDMVLNFRLHLQPFFAIL